MIHETAEDGLSGFVELSEVTRADKKVVGNKAGILGELSAAGVPIAEGLVLCTSTCKGLQTTKEFTAEQLTELEHKIATLWPDCASFAIRTSALEGERINEQNLRDTRCEYFVPKDALPIAIIAAAAAPSESHRVPPDRAVLIQPMVQAEVSGVLFAGALQAGSSESYLVEACWGLGRALVEGQTDPDRYEIDRNNRVIERERGRKQHQIKGEGSGLLVSVSEEQRLAWTLDEEQLTQISGLAKRCASVLGGAQDIEFAVTKDGLVLLQSRPVAAARLAPENIPSGKWVLYTPALENFSEPFTPLTEALLSDELPDFARLIHGRIYLDVETLNARLPLATSDEELTTLLLNRTPTRPTPISALKLLRCLPFWLSRMPWAIQFWWRSRSMTEQQLNLFWDHADAEAARPDLSAKQLFAELVGRRSRFRALFSAPWRQPLTLNFAAARHHVYRRWLLGLVKRWSHRPVAESTLAQLCATEQRSISNAMAVELSDLGQQVSRSEHLKSAFESTLDSVSLHRAINSNSPADSTFVNNLSAFLQRFGHRGPREFELAGASWSEDASSLLGLIAIAASADENTRSTLANTGHRQQLLARDDLHQAIRPVWKRRLIDYLLRRIRHHLTVRDTSRHYAARGFFLVRKKLLQIEDRLLLEKKLYAAGDIFFLSWQDITYLDNGQLSPDDAKTLIAAAKDHHAERISGSLQWILGFDVEAHKRLTAELVQPPTAQDSGARQALDRVMGLGAAPGVSEGAARVVSRAADMARFKPGEILVLANATPSAAPAIQFASGVVCDRGDSTSYLSTLARGWGVPFVAGAANCTRAITCGERLRVDGAAGSVDILSSAG